MSELSTILCSACGAGASEGEAVRLTFERRGLETVNLNLCHDCTHHVAKLLGVIETEALEAPSPDEFVDRWEDAGECDLRSMPELCGDLRPCPAHTHSRFN